MEARLTQEFTDGEVSLVWCTPNAEELIVRMARVSAPANENNMDTAPRLIRYLIKHNHWSPMEMCNLCVEIKTTRAISAQIIRHRSFSFQEFSQRYADINEIGTARVPKLRRQDLKNRQNSIDDLPDHLIQLYERRITELFEEASHLYGEMVSHGVAKECARNVLPLATPSRLYMNGTLRSYLHYCNLRCEQGTQLEHRDVAEAIKNIFTILFPNLASAMWELE
jgi:thymidylate synthase (FAD)